MGGLRLAVEPAAALPLAALATGAVAPRRGERVLLVVCGANVDLASLRQPPLSDVALPSLGTGPRARVKASDAPR